MSRAVGVEWLRLRSRRLIWVLAALGLAGAVAVLVGNTIAAMPPSAAERASAQAQVDQQLADPSFQEMVEQCRSAVSGGGSAEWPSEMNCDDLLPRADWYLNWSQPSYVNLFTNMVLAVTVLLAVAMTVIGVIFAGSDWANGTVGTQLLFQPRRGQVFVAKAIVLGVLAAVSGTVMIGAAWALSHWAAARWGTTVMIESPGFRGEQVTVSTADLLGRALRALAVVIAATLGGYALAMLFRGSLLPLALIAGYALVAETLARAIGYESTWPYLLSTRLLAWLVGPAELPIYPTVCGTGPCEPRVVSVGVAAGGTYLAVVTVAVVAVAAWSFQRRDVP